MEGSWTGGPIRTAADVDAYLHWYRARKDCPTDHGPKSERVIRDMLMDAINKRSAHSKRTIIKREQAKALARDSARAGPLTASMDLSIGFNVQRPTGKGCCWPLWETGASPTHEYCGQAIVPGSFDWCEHHCARGYQRAG